MSYGVDVDEMRKQYLVDELRRRAAATNEGRCSYCEKPVNDSERCKMFEMHEEAATLPPSPRTSLHDAGDSKGWDASRRMNVACDFIEGLGLGVEFKEWLQRQPR